jgi:hypothetical protein
MGHSPGPLVLISVPARKANRRFRDLAEIIRSLRRIEPNRLGGRTVSLNRLDHLDRFRIVHLDLHPTYEMIQPSALEVNWHPRNGGHDGGHR